MREYLTYVSVLIIILAPLPYILDTAKDRTHPNMVTWATWSLINTINMAAAFSVGAWQTGLYALAATSATTAISVLALRHGVRKYTRFDIACQVVALAGIPLWLLTKKPELAVIIVLCVDFAGGLPTLRHAWRAPQEETLKTFALSATAGLLLLLSLSRYSFVSVAMPLYISSFDLAIVLTLLYRRHPDSTSHDRPAART